MTTHVVTLGEIGRAGEIGPVSNGQERLREADKHGLEVGIIPKANMPRKNESIEGLKLIPVQRISELMEAAISIS